VSWLAGSDAYELVYPAESPVIGSLVVSFDRQEITLYFGPAGYSQRVPLADYPGGDAAREVARTTLAFIQALLADQVIVRWGLFMGRSYRRRGAAGPLWRVWRKATPWVREAVWSKYL
jgi:hypothetical protein